MNALAGYLYDFLNLFFPEVCAACGKNLFNNESRICTSCIYHFPYTNFISDPQNAVARQLWGRFDFVDAHAFLYFNKGGKVQRMLHELKYNNRPEVGFRLGELYGAAFLVKEGSPPIDLIIPVPLHPRKLKKRGYNQAEHIANGLAAVTGIPVQNTLLIRTTETETQTRKSRFDRYENMSEAFSIKDETGMANKHILLVDDVITTGGTFEGCAGALLKVAGIKISIAAVAYSK